MDKFLSTPAARASLAANIVSIATALVSVSTPLHHLMGDAHAQTLTDVCLVLIGLFSTHLATAEPVQGSK